MSDNTEKSLLASATRAATTTTAAQLNYNARGIHLVIDVTVVPGVDTITPKIQGKIGDAYYDILIGPAIVATGTTVLKVYPGITAAANASVSDFLPLQWRVVVTHSALTDFTYSVAANIEV